ncbi:galactose mutarotase [Alteromonas pelagimontana]|uniref:Aldose 1-epimerase n=1 Tax=Alteromonas pelagimontana TaxID=1858656 RepID=A0A6M4MDU8_9ALTE|nr:aldose epimerase family protein [Alteromonas pelagimontana]QJR81273.1 galactose mutarotase [Alteromonas pelagimontana]
MKHLTVKEKFHASSFYSSLTGAVVVAGILSLAGCSAQSASVDQAEFGTANGKDVYLYTLTNAKGMRVKITNYGGIITSIDVPDKNGKFDDVVLGYGNLKDYTADTNFFGALIGRYGNRIADGKFSLNDEEYTLETNDGPNHLHGGSEGFHKQVWQSESFTKDGTTGLKLTLNSEDGAGGYPGNLKVSAVYELNNENELSLRFTAKTDQATPVNLTNHSYFNLAGGGSILDHELMLNAEGFTPVNETLIPTGEVRPVKGTPFDFTQAKPIGRDIDADNQQLKFGKGYDHNFVLKDHPQGEMVVTARVTDPASGRVLEILTDNPAVQFYSGNFLDGTTTGKNDQVYQYRSAIALEPQFYPDSPNQPDFPSTILQPEDTYSSKIVYRFSTTE